MFKTGKLVSLNYNKQHEMLDTEYKVKCLTHKSGPSDLLCTSI